MEMEVDLPDMSSNELPATEIMEEAQNGTQEAHEDFPLPAGALESNESTVSPNIMSTAPVLSVNDDSPEVDPKNATRSPPKLLPAVPMPEIDKEETSKSAVKYLTGSMKNTPAALSIIETPVSSSGKSTRSTRSSIDPSFAAKQRSFLNKVHSALSSTRIEDTSSCESDAERATEDNSDDESPEYVPSSGSPSKRISGAVSNGLKRRREDHSSSKRKDITDCNGEATLPTSNDEDDESSPPVSKKSCATIDRSDNGGKLQDAFCWYCHREEKALLACASCPRVYHYRCLRRPASPSSTGEWACPECVSILRAENSETRSKALRMLSLDQLCDLLQFAVDRMKSCPGAEVFDLPVDLNEFPSYKDYIVNPMHLSLLEKNIKRRMYGSTEAFVADAAWIVHNCVIFNSYQSKLTTVAKNILRVCKQEMSEIENCPDCYKNAYTCEDNWFIKVCRKPHLLIWAKLKGFPYWPAKAMRVNSEGVAVDARFFGAHDRSWVPARDCYVYSEENPNHSISQKQVQQQLQPRKKSPRNNLDKCIEEVELHIQLLREEFVEFNYAPFKTPVNPKKLNDQLRRILPQYKPIEAFEERKATSSHHRKMAKKEVAIKQSSVAKVLPPEIKKEDNALLTKDSSVAHGLTENMSEDKIESPTTPTLQKATTVEIAKPVEEKKSSALVTCNVDVNNISSTVASSAANIAEQRLRKKDARKIGLVDRLQEKLAQWLSGTAADRVKEESSSCITDEEAVATDQKDDSSEATDQEENKSKVSDLEDDDAKASELKANNAVAIDRVSLTKNIMEDPVPGEETKDDKSSKRNNVAVENSKHTETLDQDKLMETEHEMNTSGDQRHLDKQLLLYNMSKSQPKVMLQKLVLPVTAAKEEKADSADESSENSPRNNAFVDVKKLLESQPLNKSRSSSPEIVLECVVEKVGLINAVPEIPRNCELNATNTNLSIVTETKSASVSENNQSIGRSKVNSSFSSSQDPKEKALESANKEQLQRIVRVLSPEALGISPIKKQPDTEAARKQTVMLIPVPVGVKKGDLLQESGNKLCSASEVNIAVINKVSAEGGAKKGTSIQLQTESDSNLRIDEPVVTSANVPNNSTENKIVMASTESYLSAKSGLPANIAKPAIFGTLLDQVPSGIVQNKSLTFSDGKVGIINQKGKFVQITQGSNLTQSVALSPGKSSLVSRSLSLTGSKTSTVVTVSTTSSNNSTMVRRFLPKAISLAPVTAGTSVLVASRSNTPPSMPRISVGPRNAPALTSSPTTTPDTPIITVPSTRSLFSTSATPSVPSLSKSHLLNAVGLVSKASVQQKDKLHDVESVSSTTHASPASRSRSLSAQESSSISSVSFEFQPTFNELRKVSVSNEQPDNCNPMISVGPATSNLRSQAAKLSGVFMNCLEDYLREMGNLGNLEAQVRCLQLDLEHMQWRHKQEMDELRHNTDLLISEMRDSLKVEAQRAVAEAMKIARAEKEAAVAATKQRQWCAFCGKEALFYCCWNTSYCDYKCQESHWPAHSLTCMQGLNSSEDRLAGKVDGKTLKEMKV